MFCVVLQSTKHAHTSSRQPLSPPGLHNWPGFCLRIDPTLRAIRACTRSTRSGTPASSNPQVSRPSGHSQPLWLATSWKLNPSGGGGGRFPSPTDVKYAAALLPGMYANWSVMSRQDSKACSPAGVPLQPQPLPLLHGSPA